MGIRFELLVEDSPDALAAIPGIIEKYGGRVESLVYDGTPPPPGKRHLNILLGPMGRKALQALKAELSGAALFLRMVDGRYDAGT